MEVGFSSFSLLLTFFLFVSVLVKLRNRSKRTTSRLPPGPWKLPVIGNMHQLAGSLPHRVLADLAKKHGPLMHLQLGQVPALVVSSAEAAKEVMKTHDVIFASRPQILATEIMSYNSTNIAFAPYGNYWRQLRKICISELLSPGRVQSFHSVRQEEFSELIRWVASNEGSAINLTEKLFSTSYSVTSRAALGKKSKDQETFISVMKEVTKLAGGFDIGDVFPSIKWLQSVSGMKHKLEILHKQADEILQNIVDEHRSNTEKDVNSGYEDLVDVLLRVQKDEQQELCLTTDNIKAVLVDIIAGGSETSSTTVDWAMCEMLYNPSAMKKAQNEVREVFSSKGYVDEADFDKLKYLKYVIKETLRLHPPVPLLLPRENSERCEINGYLIPAKTKVIVNAWAIGRDSRYWEDAERFKPDRFLDSSVDFKGNNFEFIPFGAGRRICPGMLFGLVNVELPLALLLFHFDWKVANVERGEELDMAEAFGISVRRKDDLLVIPIVCKPLKF